MDMDGNPANSTLRSTNRILLDSDDDTDEFDSPLDNSIAEVQQPAHHSPYGQFVFGRNKGTAKESSAFSPRCPSATRSILILDSMWAPRVSSVLTSSRTCTREESRISTPLWTHTLVDREDLAVSKDMQISSLPDERVRQRAEKLDTFFSRVKDFLKA